MSNRLAFYQIKACAHAAYEANRAWDESLGGVAEAPWDHLTEAQKEDIYLSVTGVVHDDHDSKRSHDAWISRKLAKGWSLGPKDAGKKTHPCLVEWEQLPIEQQFKDDLWVTLIKTMAAAFWKQPQ
jgi:hypothetical protein